MAGKIFYRERSKAKEGSRTPRYRVIAVTDCHLDLYGNHFRKIELEQIAKAVDAKLVALKRGKKSQSK
ncbi:MAG: hypothetical protein OCC45_12490 [Desulfotalea sp.]